MTHPNLFLIGVPKAGTTAIATELSHHSEIFMYEKEPRYFDAHIFHDSSLDYPINSEDEYISKYRDWGTQKYAIDASNFVVYDPLVVQKIKKKQPQAKFLLILRDPIKASLSMHSQRLKSQYIHMREISEDFEVCWRQLPKRQKGTGYPPGIRNSFLFRYDLLYSYQNFVPDVQEALGGDLLIISYEKYLANPKPIHTQILRFLELDEENLPSIVINESYIAKRNIFSMYLNKLKENSIGIRRIMGLTGGKFTALEKIISRIEGRAKPNRILSKSFENELKIFFEPSYKLIDRLKLNAEEET